MMDIVNFLQVNPQFFLILMVFISLFVGSFLNVVIYRLPKMMELNWSEECRIYLGLKPHTELEKLNLYLPFSHCPRCKNVIRPWHNIPLISYVWLRGKCAYCNSAISIRYPLVEALTCIMSIYVVWRFGFSWTTAASLAFTWIIICLTFIDIDYHLLPDELTLLLLWVGLLSNVFNLFTSPQYAIIGAIAGYIIFYLTKNIFEWATQKNGMGQGDVKFLAALGACLGWQMLPLIILLASLSGIFFALIHMIVKHEFKSVPLPFGPYLAVAGWVCLIWGNEIMRIYLHYI